MKRIFCLLIFSIISLTLIGCGSNKTVKNIEKNLIPVTIDNHCEYIDINGNVELSFDDYKFGTEFKNGIAILYNEKSPFNSVYQARPTLRDSQLIDDSGNKIGDKYDGIYRDGDKFVVEKDSKYGVMSKEGKLLIDIKYDSMSKLSEGLYCVSLNGLYGYINESGETVIDFKYNSALYFSEGLAAVKMSSGWNYINKNDEIIIEKNYYGAGPFKAGHAEVYLEYSEIPSESYIDKKGNVVYPDDSHYVHAYETEDEIYLRVENYKENKKILVKLSEEKVIREFSFDASMTTTDNGLIIATESNTTSIYDIDGKLINSIVIENGFFDMGLIKDKISNIIYKPYVNSNKIQIVYTITKEGISKLDFELDSKMIYGVNNNVFIVSGGRPVAYGLVSTTGEEILACTYQEIISFKDQYFIFKDNNKLGILDSKGRIIVPAQYTKIGDKTIE